MGGTIQVWSLQLTSSVLMMWQSTPRSILSTSGVVPALPLLDTRSLHGLLNRCVCEEWLLFGCKKFPPSFCTTIGPKQFVKILVLTHSVENSRFQPLGFHGTLWIGFCLTYSVENSRFQQLGFLKTQLRIGFRPAPADLVLKIDHEVDAPQKALGTSQEKLQLYCLFFCWRVINYAVFSY